MNYFAGKISRKEKVKMINEAVDMTKFRALQNQLRGDEANQTPSQSPRTNGQVSPETEAWMKKSKEQADEIRRNSPLQKSIDAAEAKKEQNRAQQSSKNNSQQTNSYPYGVSDELMNTTVLGKTCIDKFGNQTSVQKEQAAINFLVGRSKDGSSLTPEQRKAVIDCYNKYGETSFTRYLGIREKAKEIVSGNK